LRTTREEIKGARVRHPTEAAERMRGLRRVMAALLVVVASLLMGESSGFQCYKGRGKNYVVSRKRPNVSA
jgi:hypothetical protein